jgi:repressor LexA
MKLGDIISEYRKSSGLSMERFAESAGISKAYVSMLEKNKTQRGDEPSPSIEVYRSVARAIGLDLDELIRKVDGKISIHPSIPSNAIPYTAAHKAPIIGFIPAGYPVLALEDIEGYADIPYSDEENYFFLRVNGESMKNAGIHTGDLVLIRRQKCAEDGQVVAARVNGDEATLKRYKRQGDNVLLLPENPDFEPRIVPAKDFETGDAQIIGVVVEMRRSMM